jgi:hypothetical protein
MLAKQSKQQALIETPPSVHPKPLQKAQSLVISIMQGNKEQT